MSENVDTPVIFRPTVSNMLAHSASGPSLCSASFRERPHTISAAYDRMLSRPQVNAHTFEPPYGFLKAQGSASVYAMPTNVYRQTADIYARPTLCGRRFSQGAVAVAPPVVPSEYATCQKQRINTTASTDNRSAVSEKEGDIMQAHIHRSSSLPSPVYSDVCDISVLLVINIHVISILKLTYGLQYFVQIFFLEISLENVTVSHCITAFIINAHRTSVLVISMIICVSWSSLNESF